MKKRKRKPRPHPNGRLFHYAKGVHWPAIRETGALLPSDVGLTQGERSALWLTFDPVWEPSANVGVVQPDGSIIGVRLEDMDEVAGGALRVEVPTDTPMMTFSQWGAESGCPPSIAAEIWLAARKDGCNPDLWRATFDPIPQDRWICVERWTPAGWVRIDPLTFEPAVKLLPSVATLAAEGVSFIGAEPEAVRNAKLAEVRSMFRKLLPPGADLNVVKPTRAVVLTDSMGNKYWAIKALVGNDSQPIAFYGWRIEKNGEHEALGVHKLVLDRKRAPWLTPSGWDPMFCVSIVHFREALRQPQTKTSAADQS